MIYSIIDSRTTNQALRIRGAERTSAPLPPKFSADVPFFADELFKCALFEKSIQKCT